MGTTKVMCIIGQVGGGFFKEPMEVPGVSSEQVIKSVLEVVNRFNATVTRPNEKARYVDEIKLAQGSEEVIYKWNGR